MRDFRFTDDDFESLNISVVYSTIPWEYIRFRLIPGLHFKENLYAKFHLSRTKRD